MQESVEDTDANTPVPSFKGNSDVLTGEQAVNQEVGEEKEHVPVEEKAYEAGYTYPSSTEPIPDEDAPEVTSTITPDTINASISSAAGDATSSAPPAPESLSDVVPVSSSAAAALGAEETELISTDAAEAKLVEDTVQDTHADADDSKVYLPEATVRVTGDDLVPDSQVSEDNGVDGAAETTFIDPISTAPNMADDSLQEVGFGEAEEPPRATVVSDDADPVVSDQIIQEINTQEEPESKDEPTNSVAEDQTEQGPTEITEENLSADTDASQLLTTHESELERPKSPWTPSYSVTTQGPGIPTSDEVDVADLPVLPPPVVQLVASLDEHPRSDPVLAQIEPTVTVTNVQDEVEVPPLSDPPRPWTPSYSVVVQGSPLSTPVDLADPEQAAIATEHVDSLGLTQEEVKDEPNLDMPNSVMTSLIESGVIVDPSTLRDPDVEDVPLDPGSEAAVVAALIESGVLGHDAKEDELPIPALLSSTSAQEETEASAVSDGDDQLLVAPEVEITDDIPASEKMTLSQVPEIETLLTTAQSEPERPKSPWTPSYSVTQQGRVSSDGKPEEAPVPCI
ncbi:hypothetical protein B0H11DRAFT_913266 [Mycena galericulata]|nr:hypothetical protein B0H11DRAFT_913266 [Mycena galericulata]